MKNRVSDLQVNFVKIPREENEHADHLAKAASEHMLISSQVLSFIQISPLIDGINVHEISSENHWTTPITSYLKDGVLPDEKKAARKLKVQVAHFILIKDILYRMRHLRYGRGRLCHARSPRRSLWKPFWVTVINA